MLLIRCKASSQNFTRKTLANLQETNYLHNLDGNMVKVIADNENNSLTEAYGFQRKIKLAHLPLSRIQRSVIDDLLNTFKKKGEYDILRKKIYAAFDESVRVSLYDNVF